MVEKLTLLKHIRLCLETVKTFVGALLTPFMETTVETFEEIDRTKADRTSPVSVSIPKTGWNSDTQTGYPKYYDIAAPGVTEADHAEIAIVPGSLAAAKACALCPTCQTLADKIRLRAATVPTAEISAEYRIEKGIEKRKEG